MREIKFRAWNFKDKKMFSAEEMTKDQMAILPDGHFANIDGQNTSRSIIYSHEQMLPLQFTGLKDKNDKEIYEGDICSAGLKTPLGIVMHRGVIIFNEKAGQFGLKLETELESVSDHVIKNDSPEIIGNIYENPNLLENI